MDDTITQVIDSFKEPSVLHWFALFFGDWVRELFGSASGDGTNHIVTALMVALTTMNITAMVALLVVVGYTGGKAMFSGMMTANLATNISKFLPVRLITAFIILMPTTLGITGLKDFNLFIGYGQANVVRVALMGGAVADWSWGLTAKSLIRFNLGGNLIAQNTVSRSKKMAQMFVCNEYIYRQRMDAGEPNTHKFSYRTIVKGAKANGDYYVPPSTPLHASAIMDVPLPDSPKEDVYVDILFGGDKGECGSMRLSQLADIQSYSQSTSMVSLKVLMGDLKFQMQKNANIELKKVLNEYQRFAENYRNTWGNKGTESLITFITDNYEDRPVELVPVNYGALQSSTGGSDNQKLNATADALIYLAQNLSETQVFIGVDARRIMENNLLNSDSEQNTSSTLLSNSVFDRYLKGYISAGMFWSVYQELSALMFDSARYANSIVADQRNDYESLFCDTSFFTSWTNDDPFQCEEEGQVSELFEVIFERTAQKGLSSLFSNQITLSNGATANTSPAMWSDFHSSAIQAPKDSQGSGLGFMGDILFGAFNSALNGVNDLQVGDNGTLMSESYVDRPYNAVLNFDLGGQESPYTMLNNLGESLRDIYFLGNASMILLKASGTTGKDRSKDIADSLTWMPLPSWFISLAGNTIYEGMMVIVANLGKMLTAIGFAVLVLIYGIPAIPIIGWTFIVLGVFYTIISAVGAIPFSAVLIAIPKGDDLFSPDTERILSLLYGIFIRQSLIVVGFVASLFIGYVGLSLFKLIWLGTFLPRIDGLGFIDTPFAVIFTIAGFAFGVFAICLYSFRVTANIVDTVGIWFSSHLVGAFGSNHDDVASATNGIKNLSNQLDSISSAMGSSNEDKTKKGSTKKNDPKQNA